MTELRATPTNRFDAELPSVVEFGKEVIYPTRVPTEVTGT